MSVNETNETNETGVGGARADMLAHMGSLQQAAYTRPIEYQEGRAHGLKAIEVKNGPLRFVSMADRALDVCQFEYRGENLTFLSKPGLNGRNQFDTNGLEAQRSIMGGCSSLAVSRTSARRTSRLRAASTRPAASRCTAASAPRRPNM